MFTSFTAIRHQCLVKLEERVSVSPGGIIIPEIGRESAVWGAVVSAGELVSGIEEGERVFVKKTQGTFLRFPGADYVVLLDTQVLAKERKEESHLGFDSPPVTLSDGSPVSDDYYQVDPKTGQQKGYIVLAEEERKRGLVRPFRNSYVHAACGGLTKINSAIAETYARDPKFYSATFCCKCRDHFPVGEFTWDGTKEEVGS